MDHIQLLSVMKKFAFCLASLLVARIALAQPLPRHDLHFGRLASRWDEAIPLGNGMLGALIWQKGDRLRFSLDRADLWDLRLMKGLHRKEFSYQWVIAQVKKGDYAPVQKYLDEPYDREAAPSKIPGGALEFDTRDWGEVQSVYLHLQNAECVVKWSKGILLKTFVHATKPVGWFRFENLPVDLTPELKAPRYEGDSTSPVNPVSGADLSRLGYKQGPIRQGSNEISYEQLGADSFSYKINVRWKRIDRTTVEGVWSISSKYPQKKSSGDAYAITQIALSHNYASDYATHVSWWRNFWRKSSIHIPDSMLEKQWWLEQYKFGAAARTGAPPISLQAVWTADNGQLPPWKGDFHHDLNTELSYWPCYSGNHLEEGLTFLDHLDANKANYLRYTREYFGQKGLAVPGVTTLDGTEMGGWIQYSLSPTVSAWLAQHYYLQWRYGMDRNFLKQRAYPWIKQVAIFLENITVKDETGKRKLPISSSPEINDNSISAWFPGNTNFDLSLMKFVFQAASETANELGLTNEAAHWAKILSEFGDWALTENNELRFSPTMDYNQSHRHFSHMMAIFPLGLIKWEDGPRAQEIMRNSIHLLDSLGPDYWCGYSYSWLANLKARAKDGAGAAKALEIFAKAFCSPNSFHLNGDQTKSGYSKFQYRPFTLEGNFAFAAGLQEMLLQSYAGFIEIMPAVPVDWGNIEFENLRAEGAFLVSAKRSAGAIEEVRIVSEQGGNTKLKLPFTTWKVSSGNSVSVKNTQDGFVTLICKPGSVIILKNGHG
jgi:hypothetical protein